jgi:hypothetical protein
VFDDQANTSTVLTVEGIAPFAAPTGNFQRSNLAVRYVQVILTQSSGTTDAACTAAGGGAQKGFEVSGSNFGGACNPVSALFGADELASVD